MASHYEESLEFIELGLEIEPEHSSLKDLKVTVEKKIADIEGEEGKHAAFWFFPASLTLYLSPTMHWLEDEPLMDGKVLAPAVKTVLRQIFAKFDADKDGFWSSKELDTFIFATNGAHPTPQVLKQMIKNYPSTPNGLLKVEGLFEFFRRQTLDDPEETRSDLAKHGYDRRLRKIDDVAPVA